MYKFQKAKIPRVESTMPVYQEHFSSCALLEPIMVMLQHCVPTCPNIKPFNTPAPPFPTLRLPASLLKTTLAEHPCVLRSCKHICRWRVPRQLAFTNVSNTRVPPSAAAAAYYARAQQSVTSDPFSASALLYRTTLSTVLTCASTLVSIAAVGSSTWLENVSTRFRDSADAVALTCCLDLTTTGPDTSTAVLAASWLNIVAAWRLWRATRGTPCAKRAYIGRRV